MLSQSVYFVDVNIISQIFVKNIWYLTKLLIMSYIMFYWVPLKIFPQEYTGRGMRKIVFNFVYMVAYVEVIVTFLVFIKAFSILLFIFMLIATKLIFQKWYYHQKGGILPAFTQMRADVMFWFFRLMDKTKEVKDRGVHQTTNRLVKFYKSITFYTFLKYMLFFSIFIYIISTLISRGLYSYSNPVSDTGQFIDWVDFLQHNILYADNKTAGADFYGIAIIIFFTNIFTNIDLIILFSLYPILLLLALYFSIYYVVEDFSGSKYVAIFAVMIHGIVFMSPLSNFFLGKIVSTLHPDIVSFYGLHVYIPKAINVIKNGLENGYIPYIRYISGMAYEHSSIFVLLNAYFLIKTLYTKLDRYLILYALTLMLVFIFHGGGAIVLIVVSILIALNALIFRKIDLEILKKGLAYIATASIIGNMWILSMIKYGIPQDFGAAAPVLDKLLGTARNTQEVVKKGIESITVSNITTVHIAFFAMLAFAYLFSLFTKKRFVNSSFVMIPIGIFVLYFGPNMGLPLLTSQSRLAEYMFFAMTLILSFYFFYFFCKPVFLLFGRYARVLIIIVIYLLFLFLVLSVPRWMDTKFFWKNLNVIEYTSIPEIILKVNKQNRPFSWTVVSYVQEYAKVRNKGYHINTQNFLLRYNPRDKELKIDTPKIYIFVENFPNPYKGKGEWYYRWRGDVQDSLKSWIAIYSMIHSNIRIYYKTNTVTVYEIDNSKYVNYIKKMKRLKNGHFRAK
ncbi:MAG: hypothetical protein L3J44_03375 [Campylobacteraceae bacterium]|nr:hypothetical protein [Campylobacteraceae bacterium]